MSAGSQTLPTTSPLQRTSAATSAIVSLEPALVALARKTHTPVALVKALYEREVAVLEAQARIKTFIGALAYRRVKTHIKLLKYAPK